MKKIATIMLVLAIMLSTNMFAEEKVGTVVDVVNNDSQFMYGYTDSWSKQIYLDADGDVHICYKDAYVTDTDTSMVLKYANVTDGNIFEIPRNETGIGTVLMDGVGNDVYMYAGKDYWTAFYIGWGTEYGKMYKATATGVDSLSQDAQQGYYADPMWAWAQDLVVVENSLMYTFHSLWSATEWCVASFDGTTQTWGEKYNIGWTYDGNEVPGVKVYQKGDFYRNLTTAGALAVSDDGSELTVGVVSPFTNVYLFKGSFGGLIWADSMYTAPGGMEDHDATHIDAIYDTTGITSVPTTIADDQPKPWSYLELEYDADGVLHAVYNATYSSTTYDTAYGNNAYGGGNGDFDGSYFDGSNGKPRLQLLHWDNSSRVISVVAKAELPAAGETLVWFSPDSNGTPDPLKAADHGVYSRTFGFMNNPQLIINKDQQAGEPMYAVVWSEAQPGTVEETHLGGYDSTGAWETSSNYIAYHSDIKFATSDNGSYWSTPVNVTNTMEWDEHEVSAHDDIVDGKIYITYTCDQMKGRDAKICGTEEYNDQYVKFDSPFCLNDSYIMVHSFSATTTSTDDEKVVTNFKLEQNYPNPFNPTTQIAYQIPTGSVKLDVYNVLGHKVRTLVNNKSVKAGIYNVEWNGLLDNGASASSGVYIYRLTSDAGVKVKKMILQK